MESLNPEPVTDLGVEISIRTALELPALQRGMPEVLAGSESLDRPIRWVHAGEVPNMAALLKGGELLLTTGLGIGSAAGDQRRFVAELAEVGIAGLVVELGTRFRSLPRPLVAAAESRGLPLVQLHREVPFVAVTEAVHTAIVNGHCQLLQRGEEVYQRFATALLLGGGVAEVLRLLAESVGNPVFLVNGQGRLMGAAGTTPEEEESLATWVTSTRAISDEGSPVHGGVALSVAVPTSHGDGSSGPTVSRLMVFSTQRRLTAVDRIAVERASALVALALLQTRQEEELIAASHGDFLVDLAGGRVRRADADRRALALGFAHRDFVLPVAARLPAPAPKSVRPESAAGSGSGALWRLTGKAVRQKLIGIGLPILAGLSPSDCRVIVLLGLQNQNQREWAAERAAGQLGAALSDAGWAEPAVIVVGRAVTWDCAGSELGHVAEAAECARSVPPRPWHDARDLDVDLLLWLLRLHPMLHAFIRDRLDALDVSPDGVLTGTLDVLCQNLGRKSETARELGINRQTLYSRIARLERRLRIDLDDPDTLVALRLSLLARRHAVLP